MPPYRKEISDWRKRAACVTCRKSKIRCEFTSAQAVACKPCMRKGIICVMPKSVRGRALGTGTGVKGDEEDDDEEEEREPLPAITQQKSIKRLFAWLSTRDDVETKAEAEEMVSQLEMVIKQARSQIDGLKTRHGILGSNQLASETMLSMDGLKLNTVDPIATAHSPMAWDLSLVQSPDCLRTAIDQGMLTLVDAQTGFRGFMDEMRVYLPMNIPVGTQFAECAQTAPLLTLTMVICYMFCAMPPGSDSTNIDRLVIFLEQVVQEWLYHRQSQGVELIKSLLLMASYLLPAPQPKVPMYIAMAITCSFSIELGNDDDVEAFCNNPDDEILRDRLRTYACIALITLGVTSRESQIHILAMVPRIKPIREALFNHGSTVDKLVGSYCIMHHIGRNALVDSKHCQNKPLVEISGFFNHMRHEMDTLMVQTAEATENFWDSDEVRKPMIVAQLAFHIVVGEAAMNFMLFNETQRATIDDVQPVAMEVVTASQRTIDMFLENVTTRPKMPMWLFFRPLRAIAALLRLRIVFWSIGFHYDLQVEVYYNRVRESWNKLQTNDAMGLKLYDALALIERWLNIRLQQDSAGKDQSSMVHTSDKLFAFLRDAILTQSREGLTKVVEKDLFNAMNRNAPDFEHRFRPPVYPPYDQRIDYHHQQSQPQPPSQKPWHPDSINDLPTDQLFSTVPQQLDIASSSAATAPPVVSLDSLGLDMQHFESASELLKHLFSGDL